MDDLADRMAAAADALAHTALSLADLAVPAAAFGADGPGRPGRLGRALHTHVDGVLAARAREADDAAVRLGDTARAVRAAARGYDLADDAADRRLRRVR